MLSEKEKLKIIQDIEEIGAELLNLPKLEKNDPGYEDMFRTEQSLRKKQKKLHDRLSLAAREKRD